MKKFLCFLLSLVLVISLGGCSKNESSGIFSKPGTYSSTAKGINGDIVVTVEFDSERIKDIQIESDETAAIGVSAMDKLKQQVLDNQSIAVDTVAGATISSTAFIEALKDCVKQAGGDEGKLNGEIKTVEAELNTEADVIVVGAGGAGLTAAYTASKRGLSVILLEKSDALGGNTVCAANGINAYNSDVQLADNDYTEKASYEGILALQTGNDHVDEQLVKAFIDNSGETINLYSELGVDFEVSISEDTRNENPNYYMLKAEENGSTAVTMVNAIVKAVEATDVEIYCKMDAYKLVEEDGVIKGVVAKNDEGQDVTFTGNSVILCTGGFGQNRELVAEVSPKLKNARTDEKAPTTGEGLLMAIEVGAGYIDLDKIQTFPVVIEGYGMLTPNKLPGGFPMNGTIVVNNAGERFASEQFEMVDGVLSQEDGVAYAIFGEENLNDSMKQLKELGFLYEADSAEELANTLGIDAEGLVNTIASWNSGSDELFDREVTSKLDGKLYSYKFSVGAHYFMGGITINADTQVLDSEGNVIEGLYAAGEVTGGFHGTQRIDGSGTGDAFVFGRIAGNSVR